MSQALQDIGLNESRTGENSLLFSAWLYRIGRVVLAGIFLWSGLAKIQDPQSFAVIIEAFGLLPEFAIEPVALLLPVLEIVAAVGILGDVKGSLGLITGMLLLFIFVLGFALHMGLDVDCGCFGPDDPEAEAFHSLRPSLYRDFVMMAGVAYLYIWRYVRSARPVRLAAILTVLKKGKNND
ncbi:MAG: DoxX family membrane protein [Desulfatibacillum sp.]|nr:DoxX family membrane protein [Desulfatibacillum sp.]